MFYVANVIKFSVFLELLWNSTLIIHYKLNRFWPPWANQFDICALLFVGCDRFTPLYKIVLYLYG